MGSDWKEVRDKLHDTIAAITPSTLGFASAVNVKKYLPELSPSHLWDAYFYAGLTGGERGIRIWAVDAASRLVYDRIPQSTVSVETTARVLAWYDVGVGGAGIELVKDHMSVVQQAIKALGITLGGKVLRVLDWGTPSFALESGPLSMVAGDEGDMIRAEFQIVADNPNGTI